MAALKAPPSLGRKRPINAVEQTHAALQQWTPYEKKATYLPHANLKPNRYAYTADES
jgi:hypothetical protein